MVWCIIIPYEIEVLIYFFLYMILILTIFTIFMVSIYVMFLANCGHNIKLFFLNILLNAKWNNLLVLIVLRTIKSPIYLLLENFYSDWVVIYCLYIFVGAIITYSFHKYILVPYINNSPVFKFLDRHVLDDVLGMNLLFVPMLVISCFTSGFVLMNVSEFSTMRLASENTITALRDEYNRKLCSNWNVSHLFHNNWRTLEIIANSLERNKYRYSKEHPLLKPLLNHLEPIKVQQEILRDLRSSYSWW